MSRACMAIAFATRNRTLPFLPHVYFMGTWNSPLDSPVTPRARASPFDHKWDTQGGARDRTRENPGGGNSASFPIKPYSIER